MKKVLANWISKGEPEQKLAALRLGSSLGMTNLDAKTVATVYADKVPTNQKNWSASVGDIVGRVAGGWEELKAAVAKVFKSNTNAINKFAAIAEDAKLSEETSKVDFPDFAVALLDKNNPNHKAALRVIRILNNTDPN